MIPDDIYLLQVSQSRLAEGFSPEFSTVLDGVGRLLSSGVLNIATRIQCFVNKLKNDVDIISNDTLKQLNSIETTAANLLNAPNAQSA